MQLVFFQAFESSKSEIVLISPKSPNSWKAQSAKRQITSSYVTGYFYFATFRIFREPGPQQYGMSVGRNASFPRPLIKTADIPSKAYEDGDIETIFDLLSTGGDEDILRVSCAHGAQWTCRSASGADPGIVELD